MVFRYKRSFFTHIRKHFADKQRRNTQSSEPDTQDSQIDSEISQSTESELLNSQLEPQNSQSTEFDLQNSQLDPQNSQPTEFELQNSQLDPQNSQSTESNLQNSFFEPPLISCPPLAIRTALNLHAQHNFSRKDVAVILNVIDCDVVQPIVRTFSEYIHSNFLHDANLERKLHLAQLINTNQNAFSQVKTDYQLFVWLREHDLLVDAHEYTINNSIEPIFREGNLEYDADKCTGVLMPLDFQFRRIFEKDQNLFSAIKERDKILSDYELNGTHVKHIISSAHWQKRINPFSGEIVMPYYLYIDDAEVNNPLGGHTDPISFVYYSLIRDCEIFGFGFQS